MKRSFLLFLAAIMLKLSSAGQSLYFNGSNTYVNLTNNASLQLQAFTLEAWIKPMGTGSSSTSGSGGNTAVPIITKGRGEADVPSNLNVNFFMGINAQKKIAADFEQPSGANRYITSSASIRDSIWTHVAVSYEPVTAVWKIYINGVLDTAKDLGSNIVPASESIQPAAIGTALNSKGVPAGCFRGKIDEVRIWKIARAGTDIFATYKTEVTAGIGLLARYGLNEGAGTTTVDAVAGNAYGTIMNSAQWTNGFNNTAPGVPSNPSPGTSASIAGGTATLCATVSDRNKDKLRARFYGRKKRKPEKFTMVLLPDTQFYTAEQQGTNGGTNTIFKTQTSWIAANRAARNIVYVGQLGDCVQHGDGLEVEWRRADTAIKTIENASRTGLAQGIPYGICVGNHDQTPFGDPAGTTALYNKYFGASRFSGRSYYGGHYGADNDNHYQLFTAGGLDFLVLCPEYDQTSGFAAAGRTLDWMVNLVKSYPKRKVIVLSHYVLTIDATFSPQGKAIYDQLKVYPNFILMVGGHITQRDGESRRTDTYNGNTVHTISSDYQSRIRGGNGLLRTFEFDPQNNKITVQTYSPYTNAYEADANSQFDLPVNLSSGTDPYTLIGETGNLAPGAQACASWAALEPGAAYEWYVNVFDGEKTVAGPAWLFTTPQAITALSRNGEPAVVQEPASGSLFAIYPNPNSIRHLTLSFFQNTTGRIVVEIYDANGILHLKKTYENAGNTVGFAHNLAAGIYTVVVSTGRRKEAGKLLIQ